MNTASRSVAVIGAGASGTLVAAHLARRAARTGAALLIALIDKAQPGTGLAYSTTEPRHRLNVPARGMSAWPDDPGHFIRWLHREIAADFPEDGYASRTHYAKYLASVLEEAGRESPRVTIEHVAARVVDVRRVGRRLRLSFEDGVNQAIDAAVLATGHGVPSVRWATPALQRSPLFIADPWRAAATPHLDTGGEIVLVGTGLTATDMALQWGEPGLRIHMVSRHGMLPLADRRGPRPPVVQLDAQLPTTLAEARRLVFDLVRRLDGDWQRAVDSLRPVTSELWQTLGIDDRRAFLSGAVRRWERVRHRVDPAVHTWLEQRQADGSLVVHTGEVLGTESAGSRIRVSLSDGSTIDAAAVVNCTGASGDVRTSEDALTMNLLDSGFAQSGPLHLGFKTDRTGRLVSASGAQPAAWAVGPVRRGEVWESTAVPEIREQAARLADELLNALPAKEVVRRPRDPYGLPLSTSTGASLRYVEALQRILRVQSGAGELLADAVREDPGFALGHAVRALLGVEWGVDVDVDASLAAAQSVAAKADERERRFIEVAAARVHAPGARSAAALISYIHAYPEDALAVSLAVPTIAFGGATEVPAEAWALIEGLAPAYRDDWWYLGMLAFIRQEQSRFAEAEELAARSIEREPASGHAVHAKAHVHYETGDHRAGLTWLDGWITTCGPRASHLAHFSWHAALHELELGDAEAIARRYATQLAPPNVTGVRALVDSASLLWRAQMAGVRGVGDLARVISNVAPDLLTEPPTPFTALHAAIALTAAGDCHGLSRLQRWARSRDDGPFIQTIAPLADCLSDLVHGDPERATDGLLALRGVERLGGSAAQQQVVEDTVLYAAVQAGRHEVATDIINRRLERRDSPRERRIRDALRKSSHEEMAAGPTPPAV